MPKGKKSTSTHVRVFSGSMINTSATGSRTAARRMNMTQVSAARKQREEARKTDIPRLAALVRQRLAEAVIESGRVPADVHFMQPIPEEDLIDVDPQGGESDDSWLDVEDAEDEDEPDGLGGTAEDIALRRARLQAIVSLYGGRMRTGRDHRTRAHRRLAVDREWTAIAPSLVDAYMAWKYGGSSPQNDEEATVFSIQVIGLSEHDPARSIMQRSQEEANVSLVRCGLLGASPFYPTLAFTLDLLEFYHQLRRRHPSVGIQGFAKVICAVNGISYFPALQEKLSRTVDVYLDILKRLRRIADHALGRDTEGWRLTHGCPCCDYKQADEPALVPARLQVMDGCSSQKRLRGVGHSDTRTFNSDYFLLPKDVDRFANEIKSRAGRAEPVTPDKDLCEDSLPTSNQRKTKCTEHWQAANATAMGKSVTEVFDQTGIFLCACRHGVVELVEEMVRSGEQAKYALAIIDAVMTTYGKDQCLGYDIGCNMDVSVRSTSLAPAAAESRLQLVVNAFHGYAHERPCQLEYHPLYRHGLGIEDLETCERVFSSLNGVARSIRHASLFHWKQYIDLHLMQWDLDRYGELSRFIYNNYRQALGIIIELEPEVALFKRMTRFTDRDFVQWHSEEVEYLATLQDGPEEDGQKIAYVEGLDTLASAYRHYSRITTVEFNTFTVEHFGPGFDPRILQPAIAQAKELERRAAQRKLELAMNVADDLEKRLGIMTRWTLDSPEYIKISKYVRHRKFARAVDELEGLIVQRLFELAKANASGTSYKLRKHIAQAITRRSATVRASLERYNTLAVLQDPPRPVLEYREVADYTWLGDFGLLKESRPDILDKAWSKPVNRAAASKYFKIVRAREELVRLDIEVRRLQAWVDFEDDDFDKHAEDVSSSNPLLSRHIRSLASRRRKVNDAHRRWFLKISQLKGYSGQQYIPGARSSMPPQTPFADPQFTSGLDEDVGADDAVEEDIGIDEDDELNDEMLRVGDVLSTLMV